MSQRVFLIRYPANNSQTVWSWVRTWTARTLETAGDRVLDVQGDEDDEEEVEVPIEPEQQTPTAKNPEDNPAADVPVTEPESRKTQ